MSNVVKIRPRRNPRMEFAAGPAFEKAWRAYPESGRRRSSRKLAMPEWAVAACQAGEDVLLAAVLRYAREDTDHTQAYGAPGFHRWLSAGRWEVWIEEPVAPVVFGNQGMRDAFHASFRDQKARQWFDRCKLDGDTLVIPHMPNNPDWLSKAFGRWALAQRIGGWRLA